MASSSRSTAPAHATPTPVVAASAPADAPPTAQILLFARAVLALLDLWPALTIAVAEQWGGRESADKKTWLASTIIDEFQAGALDFDDLADLLHQVMSDEFDANIEDGSVDQVAGEIVRVWASIQAEGEGGAGAEATVVELERRAEATSKKGIQATKGTGPEVDGEGDSSDEDDSEEDVDGMEVDEVPQLVPATGAQREKPEKVVDEDGFEVVQKGGRRSGR